MNASLFPSLRPFVSSLLVCLPLALVSSGCSVLDIAIEQGNGEAAEETREVEDFTAVSVSAGIDAEVAVGEEAEVRVEADANQLEHIETVVEEGVLRIRPAGKGMMLRSKTDMVVHVSLPALQSASASGGADLRVRGLDGGDLSLSVSGGSDARVEGRAGAVSAKVSGGSDLDARGLEADSFDVSASGGSDASLGPAGSLSASASGGSDVCYDASTEDTRISESGGSDVEPCG